MPDTVEARPRGEGVGTRRHGDDRLHQLVEPDTAGPAGFPEDPPVRPPDAGGVTVSIKLYPHNQCFSDALVRVGGE